MCFQGRGCERIMTEYVCVCVCAYVCVLVCYDVCGYSRIIEYLCVAHLDS